MSRGGRNPARSAGGHGVSPQPARVGPVELACVAALTLVAVAAMPFRGLNLWSLWFVDSTSRMTSWRAGGGEDAMRAAFADPNAVPPVGPWLSSLLSSDALFGARFGAALAAAAVVALVYGWAGSHFGRRGAVMAAAALLLQPRFWGAATVPGPTIWALLGVVVLWRTTLAARDDLRALPLAIVGGAFGLASGLPAWTAAAPLAWLILVQPGTTQAGLVRIRAVGLWTLLLPALWVGLLVAAVPWLHADPVDRLGSMFFVWLERPAEPFLAAGRLWGRIRMWPWTPLQMVAATTPLVLVLTALAGLPRRRVREVDGSQERTALYAWAALLPFVLRSAFHGGMDLLIFPALALAFLVADASSRVGPLPMLRAFPAAVCAVVVLVGAADLARSGGVWEGYRSSAIGGARGAVERGWSRYPHGPVPPQPLQWASERGARRFAIVSNEWEARPVFEYYRERGILPADAVLVGSAEADAFAIALDDALPELYGALRDWMMFASSSPDAVSAHVVEGVPVFAVGVVSTASE